MPNYVYDTHINDKGYHEIHENSCPYSPLSKDRLDIGYHATCHDAVRYLKSANRNRKFKFDGCPRCCRACHVGSHNYRPTLFRN